LKNGEPVQPASEQDYRKRWTWDAAKWSTHCQNCIANCSYKLYIKDGDFVVEEQSGSVPGYSGYPDMNPLGCQKGTGWQVQVRNKDRIAQPLKRVGERGSGSFEPISWDQAVTEIADIIVESLANYGGSSVMIEGGAEGGVVASVARSRLNNAIGAVNLDGNASVSDIHQGHWMTFGNLLGGSGAEDTFVSELIFIWNANPAFTRIPYYHYLTEARYNGARVITVAPDYSPSTIHSDYHIAIRPGADAAFALAMANVIIEEGLVDYNFVRSQTDLPLFVKLSDSRFLREQDILPNGSPELFYASLGKEVVQVSPLRLDPYENPPEYDLNSTYEVTDKEGNTLRVTTVYGILKERLKAYTPEAVEAICGVNATTIRKLARLVASSRTKLYNGLGSCKQFHGDLMERSMDLVLALTGNWGKPGTGWDTYIIALLEGEVLSMFKSEGGAQASEQAMAAIENFMELLRTSMPGASDGKIFLQLMKLSAPLSGAVPPAFFYYYHCGFDQLWDNVGGYPMSPAEYLEKARSKGWWSGLVRPEANTKVKVYLQAGTNILRRTRGGQRMLLPNFWRNLDLAVCVDWRMNTSMMFADYILPVACEGERIELHAANSHSYERMISEKAFEPLGDSKPEWEVFSLLAKAITERAQEKNYDGFTDSRGVHLTFGDVYKKFSLNGTLLDGESVIDELLRDSAISGNLNPNASLKTILENGWVKPKRLPLPLSAVCGYEISDTDVCRGYENHVKESIPYETLTGRAQFYIDHPWFIAADEHLPRHKEVPVMGGNYPFYVTGGHPRWSIHATNTTSNIILETTRGTPTVHLSAIDAKKLGVNDHEFVEIFNDHGRIRLPARLSSAVSPGQVIIYAAWEQYLFPEWKDVTWVEPGHIKGLHFAGGYGHLGYSFMQWQPTQSDRLYRVGIKKVTF
jgi:DMSO reductase family type II enzyme molybdopterin subunit